METLKIKTLLQSPKVESIKKNDLVMLLTASILKVYTLSGMIKNYEPEQLNEEVNLISNQLAEDITNETDLKGLRVMEIDYCLLSGLKGEFDVKTYGLNYPTFYKWLNIYSVCSERKQAHNSIEWDSDRKQLTVTCEPTPEEQKMIIINGVDMAYQDYLQEAHIRAAGTPVENVLLKIHDFGGMRDRFLINEGIKPANMSLSVFFDNCRRDKVKSIKDLFNKKT